MQVELEKEYMQAIRGTQKKMGNKGKTVEHYANSLNITTNFRNYEEKRRHQTATIRPR